MGDDAKGLAPHLKNIPLCGFSTVGQFAGDSVQEHRLVVMLLAGDQLQCRSAWYPLDSITPVDGRIPVVPRLLGDLDIMETGGTLNLARSGLLLMAVDGFNPVAMDLDEQLPSGRYALAACLTGDAPGMTGKATTSFCYRGERGGGQPHAGASGGQYGGGLAGDAGLTAAWITGGFKVGIGVAHGWQSVGLCFTKIKAEGLWLRTLDGQSPVDTYARVFGHDREEWLNPPLNTLSRLNPLGFEIKTEDFANNPVSSLLLRSPMVIERDGSFRMSALPPKENAAHLMVGSVARCQDAARQAAEQAINNLGVGRPVMALVLVDVAWKMLYEASATTLTSEIEAIRTVLGPDLPIVGGYTVGQMTHKEGSPQMLNQHIRIIVVGERVLG